MNLQKYVSKYWRPYSLHYNYCDDFVYSEMFHFSSKNKCKEFTAAVEK